MVTDVLEFLKTEQHDELEGKRLKRHLEEMVGPERVNAVWLISMAAIRAVERHDRKHDAADAADDEVHEEREHVEQWRVGVVDLERLRAAVEPELNRRHGPVL